MTDIGANRYSVEQSTRWLSRLARGMQAHHQTVFMIEQLQPSWLSSRFQRGVYVVASRLFVGVLFAMAMYLFIFGLLVHYGQESGMTGKWLELLDGRGILVLGFTFGMVDLPKAWRSREPRRLSRVRAVISRLARIFFKFWLIYIIADFTWSMFLMAPDEDFEVVWKEYLEPAMFLSVIAGLYWSVRSTSRTIDHDIQPAEAVKWVHKNAFIGLAWGALVGLSFYEVVSFERQFFSSDVDLDLVLFTVYFSLIGAFFGGFQKAAFVSETRPNHGITRSARRAFRTSILLAVLSGGTSLLFLVFNAVGQSMDPGLPGGMVLSSISLGLSFGIFAALRYGIMDVAMHYILRVLLAAGRKMPLDIARFLDYAAQDLQFMQKVGGGYIFMHRNLLEYFASLPEQAKPGSATGKAVAAGEAP